MGVRGNPNERSTQLQILVHALPPVLVKIHADVFYLACTVFENSNINIYPLAQAVYAYFFILSLKVNKIE